MTFAVPSPDSSPWLALPRRAVVVPSVRLFCLPHAGGGASTYRHWQQYFPAEIEVCPIQLPGRESRCAEAPIDDMERLVEPLIHAIGNWLDRPYALFGHSNGALIAFALARQLAAIGNAPRLLVVSASRAPHLPSPRPKIHRLPVAEFIAAVTRFEGIPQAVLESQELLEIIVPALRADFAINETYQVEPDATVPCPLWAYAPDADLSITPAGLAAWKRHTTADRFRLEVVAGGHFYLREQSEKLAAAISEELCGAAR